MLKNGGAAKKKINKKIEWSALLNDLNYVNQMNTTDNNTAFIGNDKRERRVWNMDPACWLWKKGSRLWKQSAWGNLYTSPTWSTRPTNGCGTRSTSLWVHRNLFWQLPRNGNLHSSGVLQATTAFPKPFFRAFWRVGDAVISRRNAGWTTSKCGHPYPCQNCSQGPPAEKAGEGSLRNRPSCPPTTQSVKGLNWIEVWNQIEVHV